MRLPAPLVGLHRTLQAFVSAIALGIVFYLVVTPTGLVLRMLGTDPLRRKRDPQAASYWIERAPAPPAAESFRREY